MESKKENGIVNYKNGKLEGEWKFYHENEKIRTIGNYWKERRRMEILS